MVRPYTPDKIDFMRHTLLIILLLLVLSGCDIPGKIVVSNTSADKIFYREERIIDDSVRTIAFELDSQPPGNETMTFFAYGHSWTDETIRKYVASVNRIGIISSTDTLVLTDKNKMFEFLKSRRRGIFKQVIAIKIR